jgi:N-acetylmuramoyl-L-alanine amidase CwlA
MYTINRVFSIKEFEEYVDKYRFGILPANKLILHHTFRPSKKQWNGKHTMDGLKSYYEKKGWRSGPHIFVAEDGIWLFSPMNRNGTHAGIGNLRSIGIEVVGDYDVEKWSGNTKKNALSTISILMKRLDIDTGNVKFHRDFSKYKTCPGAAITKEWLFRELDYYSQDDDIPDWKNVAGKLSAEEVLSIAKEKRYISSSTKFNDPLTAGKLMIFLARIFPDKFKK